MMVVGGRFTELVSLIMGLWRLGELTRPSLVRRKACWTVPFFFQAEVGIRAVAVTGVQTCALPISHDDQRAGTRSHKDRAPCGADRRGRTTLRTAGLWASDRIGPRRGVARESHAGALACLAA